MQVLRPAAEVQFAPASQATLLNRTTVRKATERRVAAGGSAHENAPDVRRTGNLSQEKRIAAQRIAHDVIERLRTLVDLGDRKSVV